MSKPSGSIAASWSCRLCRPPEAQPTNRPPGCLRSAPPANMRPQSQQTSPSMRGFSPPPTTAGIGTRAHGEQAGIGPGQIPAGEIVDEADLEPRGVVAAEYQYRGSLGDAGHAADQVATLVMPGEVVNRIRCPGNRSRRPARRRASRVRGGRPVLSQSRSGPWRHRVAGVEIGRTRGLAAVGGHQEVARPAGSTEVQQGASGIHQPADALADIQPAAVPGAGI